MQVSMKPTEQQLNGGEWNRKFKQPTNTAESHSQSARELQAMNLRLNDLGYEL